MKKTKRLFSALAALALCATAVLAGCSSTTTAVITPVDEETDVTEETIATVATPEGELSMHDVWGLSANDANRLTWSVFEPYTHTDIDDTTAYFPVTDEYGREYSLTVTHGAQGDPVSAAILAKGDNSIDILIDDVPTFWREVLLAEKAASGSEDDE